MDRDEERRIRDAVEALKAAGEHQAAANVEAVVDGINEAEGQAST